MSNSAIYQRVRENPKFAVLVSQRQNLAFALSGVVLAGYLSLVLTLAFNPSWLAAPLWTGSATTVGVPLVAGLLVLSWLLMGIYVRRANIDFDRLSEELGKESGK
jgi:uncharacterized membrane protein (DUF485 family)